MASNLHKLRMSWQTYKKFLDGVFCIYKPTETKTGTAISIVKSKLIKDLNSLRLHEPPQAVLSSGLQLQSGHDNKQTLPQPAETNSSVTMATATQLSERKESLLKYKLVFGEVFMADDIYVRCICPLHYNSSGVLLVSVGFKGLGYLNKIEEAKFLRVYHVKGRFGYATDNFFPDGNFIERSSYHHITKGKLDKVCSAAQSGHQRLMFEYAGVNPHSQEAYQLACQGIIRPLSTETPPILYGVKCIYFNPPDFTLEIHAINETCEYMAELVNDIGLKLKSNAVCAHIHRIRHGHFVLDDTLLHKDWSLWPVKRSMENCKRHLTPEKLLTNLAIDSETERKSVTDNIAHRCLSIEQDFPSALDIAKTYSRHNTQLKDAKNTQEKILLTR